MKSIAIIPARMGSSRFPGKPLKKIQNIPMIGHCFFRTQMCKELKKTYVATCDQEIKDYVLSIGGNVIMTSDRHERASDRTAEAMIKAEEELKEKIDIVVMVQGDEPMVTPQMITKSLAPFLQDEKINVVNLMAPIQSVEEFENPDEVKVVINNFNDAIYFSREPIPSRRKGFDHVRMLKQVCIIPFRRDYLLKFNSFAETELERVESVDMMRVIENGDNVRMVMSDTDTYSVDTPADLEYVQRKMMQDELIHKYK